ncbi:hypothetical protein HK405_014783 [Cladochytrium tenue]|nr:hypothetical protein HK405_014783 [Cladochytrium tenue]
MATAAAAATTLALLLLLLLLVSSPLSAAAAPAGGKHDRSPAPAPIARSPSVSVRRPPARDSSPASSASAKSAPAAAPNKTSRWSVHGITQALFGRRRGAAAAAPVAKPQRASSSALNRQRPHSFHEGSSITPSQSKKPPVRPPRPDEVAFSPAQRPHSNVASTSHNRLPYGGGSALNNRVSVAGSLQTIHEADEPPTPPPKSNKRQSVNLGGGGGGNHDTSSPYVAPLRINKKNQESPVIPPRSSSLNRVPSQASLSGSSIYSSTSADGGSSIYSSHSADGGGPLTPPPKSQKRQSLVPATAPLNIVKQNNNDVPTPPPKSMKRLSMAGGGGDDVPVTAPLNIVKQNSNDVPIPPPKSKKRLSMGGSLASIGGFSSSSSDAGGGGSINGDVGTAPASPVQPPTPPPRSNKRKSYADVAALGGVPASR